MKILLLSTIGAQAIGVAMVVKANSGTVDVVESFEAATDALSNRAYDLLLLDFDALALSTEAARSLRSLRQSWPEPRLLVLASTSGVKGALDLLDQMADDFILKPIHSDELIARIGLLLSAGPSRRMKALEAGPVLFDLSTRHVWLAGEGVDLTARERSVLYVLLANSGRIISKDQIASRVFSVDDETAVDVIEVYIHRLRRKLAHPECRIRTVRGLGYVFEVTKT